MGRPTIFIQVAAERERFGGLLVLLQGQKLGSATNGIWKGVGENRPSKPIRRTLDSRFGEVAVW
jgi:hypothetical protein